MEFHGHTNDAISFVCFLEVLWNYLLEYSSLYVKKLGLRCIKEHDRGKLQYADMDDERQKQENNDPVIDVDDRVRETVLDVSI